MPRAREKGTEIDEIISRSNAATTRRATSSTPLSTKDTRRPVNDLDGVLDKISQQGIGSLTSDERKLLEERSRELRRDRD
jgi:hypothetical protein